jgi:quercetin dioxygenase-like cupin family protein
MRTTILGTLAVLVAAMATGDASHHGTVAFYPAADVKAAFAKGRPLVEVEGYKIHASRREAPGDAEIHTLDTDIIYVLEGRATIETGGTLVGGRTIAPAEIRAARITGGTPRALAPGDVLVVPGGTPHQFTAVEAPFLYYVVKVTGPASGGPR